MAEIGDGPPESINDDLTPPCHTVATGLQLMESIACGQGRDARTQWIGACKSRLCDIVASASTNRSAIRSGDRHPALCPVQER
jgi:hypothetical protein